MKRLLSVLILCVFIIPTVYGETATFADGSKYIGEMSNGIPHGQGTLTWASGNKYVGEWKDGNRHGQGTYTWTNGDKYVGQYQDGNRHGQGTYTWANGDKYVGQYQDGKFHGQGTFTFPDGRKYVGAFKDGKRDGQGTFTFPDGRKYVGAFKDGKFHGQGTYTWANGDKYVGQYQDGNRHGQGTFTLTDGDKYVVEWKDDQSQDQETSPTLATDKPDSEQPGEGYDPLAASFKYRDAVSLKSEYYQEGSLETLFTALDTIGDAIRLDLTNPQYWITLGDIYTELTRFNLFRSHEYAETSFRQALALTPDDASIMILLAVRLAKTDECEEALQYFEKAVMEDILLLSVNIIQWMNACYLTDAHTKRGTIFFENVQKNYPEYYYLNFFQAVLYNAHFDHDSARRELQEILDRDASDEAVKKAAQKLLSEVNEY